jgi:tRNA modification GTPase
MYRYQGQEETIVAVATPPGTGSIALVRLSGGTALSLLEKMFVHSRGRSLEEWPSHTARHGQLLDIEGRIVDEVLVTLMRAPHSYTGENVVEIGCHGGSVAARFVVEACVRGGARLAQPGEFTKRAFLNGRMDLAQAEAVADIICARTQAALRAGSRQLNGELSRQLEFVREAVLESLAGVEALLNFPEDATDKGQVRQLRESLQRAILRVKELLSTAQAGCVLREGVRAVIAGKPNVGKSSLLNAFLRQERAIVTDIAGTTRDVLEEAADVAGFPVNFLDTAGILVPRDAVEEKAVQRSRHSIENADVVILVLDVSRPLAAEDRELMATPRGGRPWLVVLNKADLPRKVELSEVSGLMVGCRVLMLSLLTREGFSELERAVAECVGGGAVIENGALVTHLRHVEALDRARLLMERAAALDSGTPLEMAAEDMKMAVRELDRVTGKDFDADLIERIFSGFCIGK